MKKSFLLLVSTVLIVLIYHASTGPEAQSPSSREAPIPGSSRLAELLGDDAADGYAKALAPRRFRFPADHGPHPEFRNEWWYVTGNLDSDAGTRLGFELTLFRFALTPEAHDDASGWRTNQIYIGHLALTDVATETFHVAERYSRGSLGLAGAAAEPFHVWLEDWELAETSSGAARPDGPHWRLRAADRELAIDLELTPLKAPVLNGVDGLSQKSSQPGNASYYYSMTRIRTEGRVRVGEVIYSVSGLSWFDREWSSSALAADQSGWDWFALQLDDGSELMFYNLRKLDGTQDPMSAGTFVAADGRKVRLERNDLSIEILDFWDSPAGGRYPSRWRLEAPALHISLEIAPVMDAQELATAVRYWEGAVDVSGRARGNRVDGRGYVELTGYAVRSEPTLR